MTEKRTGFAIDDETYRKRPGDFSGGRWSGDTLFLAGVVAVDPATQKVITGYRDLPTDVVPSLATGQMSVDIREGPMIAQAWFCFTAIERILQSQGLTLAHIVKINHLLTDFTVFPAYNRVRQMFFPVDPPASTVIEVKGLLPSPEVLLEVDVVASRNLPNDLGLVEDVWGKAAPTDS